MRPRWHCHLLSAPCSQSTSLYLSMVACIWPSIRPCEAAMSGLAASSALTNAAERVKDVPVLQADAHLSHRVCRINFPGQALYETSMFGPVLKKYMFTALQGCHKQVLPGFL